MFLAEIRGITMHYDRLGSGEPLVLIHGLAERKEGWMHQHPLADRYELIIPDLRGHGRSDAAEEISIESFAKDVLALLDTLDLESAHICGLSMGGLVAQEIYRMAPERCRSLILVSTFYYVPKLFGRLIRKTRLWRAANLSKRYQLQLAARTCLYAWTKENVARFLHAVSPRMESYPQSVAACVQVDNRRLLRKIKVPTLIIGSQYDMLTPIWAQIMMHHRIPGSSLVILRNAGHLAKIEKPEEFNRTLRRFLDRQTLRRAS